ncbi:mitochondrial mRNA processing protein [Lasiosphaeria hispida]|uniref:Mitochondrial mRNA processing protein n=1 Tax=Lasiosphaeria hispida TaxID=260671 RepID=A0AAJ0HRB2_9PEZI|nr:mitochondrial mRNA processing protein [Lasiosphaeria hispida]
MITLGSQARRSVKPLSICAACRHQLTNLPTQRLSAPVDGCAPRQFSTSKATPKKTPSRKRRPSTKKPPSATLNKSRIQLWEDTLAVLKDIQASTARSPVATALETASAPVPSASDPGANAVPSAEKLASGGKQLPAGEGVSAQHSPEGRLLTGALTILKRVLRQESSALRNSSAADDADEDDEGYLHVTQPKKPNPEPKEKTKNKKKPTPKLMSKSAVKTEQQTVPVIEKKIVAEKPKLKTEEVKVTKTKEFTVKLVDPRKLALVPVQKQQPPVPGLSYGLDRVLFNPGVYHLQDPRSRVFNFDPYLARIMPIKEFDFNALKQYVTSSKDLALISIAQESKKKYTGSTSSMTAMLAHFHFLLSAWRPVNDALTSRNFQPDSKNFTRIMRAPAATFLHYKDGTYAIDADKQFDTANILSMLGKSMEKLLTLPKDEFEKYRKSKSDQLTDEERNGPEAFHYTTLGDFMMRSQLDAYDPRIPGTGMFDVKTRAVVSIRMDSKDFQKGLGYEIRGRFGQWESFEREYFDMIRSAFLKYSLQVRMGRMDGIFVAFHNTERIFGFQYVPLAEMDLALHGTTNSCIGNQEFKASLFILNEVLDKATKKFPHQSLRLFFETRPSDPPFMYIFAKPVTPGEIEKVQGTSRAKIEEFEQNILGLRKGPEIETEDSQLIGREEEGAEEDDVETAEEEGVEETVEADEGQEETNLDVWEDMMAKVEDTLENEEQGVTTVRAAIEHALWQSGLLHPSTPDESRHYLDSLLQALTSSNEPEESSINDTAVVESADAQTNKTQDPTVSTIDSDEVSMADGQIDAGNRPALTTEEAEDPTYQVGVEHAEVEQAGSYEGTHTPAAQESPPDEPTLKDLILRLAAQVQAVPSERRISVRKTEQQAEDELTADAARLHKFETILLELISKSRESSQGVEESASSPVDTSGTQEQTQAGEGRQEQSASEEAKEPPEEGGEIFGMILTSKNKVNESYVDRPEDLEKRDKWVVEYAIEEIPAERADRLYKMMTVRRRKVLGDSDEDKDKTWRSMFKGKLEEYSSAGRIRRAKETALAKQYPVFVTGEKPYTWDSVFGEEGAAGHDYKTWVGTDGKDWAHSSTRGQWNMEIGSQEAHSPPLPNLEPSRQGGARREDTSGKAPSPKEELSFEPGGEAGPGRVFASWPWPSVVDKNKK